MPISQDERSTTRLGRASKPSVAVVMRAGADRGAIGQQLALVAVVRFLDSVDALDAAITDGAIHVVVTDVDAWRGRMAALRAGATRSRPLGAPLIIYDSAERLTIDALPALIIPGMPSEFVVCPVEPLLPAVRRAIADDLPPSVGPVILRRLLPLAPVSLRVFLSLAVLKATTGRGVDQLARWSRISPRTVERRLARAGWETAQVVLQTVRALDAVWLMSEHQWAARRIQRVREFAHSSSITRLMQRYLGDLTPAGVREGSGFDSALDFACRALVHRSTDE
jgi:hypothetical protein